jgi:hypothetical protein
MLQAQVYDSHASTTMRRRETGFEAAPSRPACQFAPLCVSVWGNAWFEPDASRALSQSLLEEESAGRHGKTGLGETQCTIRW